MSQPPEIDRSPKAMKARLEVFENVRKLLEEDFEILTNHYPKADEAELINRMREVLRK